MEESDHFLESVSHADLVTGHVLAKLCISGVLKVTVLTLWGVIMVGRDKNFQN